MPRQMLASQFIAALSLTVAAGSAAAPEAQRIPHQAGKALVTVDVRDTREPRVAASVAVTPDGDGRFSVLLRGNYA